MKRTILLMMALLCVTVSFAQKKNTYKVAQRDTCDLYMDVYDPVVIPGDTLNRPTILYVFGGGFIMGQRSPGSSFSTRTATGWYPSTIAWGSKASRCASTCSI